MTKFLLRSVLAVTFFTASPQLRADHIEFLSKPYPRIELFPGNIMKPYEASVIPWIEEPEEALPTNFQYILKPFYMQFIHWVC